MLEYAFYKIRELYPRTPQDYERDQKYAAFKRLDLDKLSRMYFLPFTPFILPKILMGYSSIAICATIIYLIGASRAKKAQPYKGWRFKVVRFACAWCARIVLLMWNILYVFEQKVHYDYSKYLGPDYKEPDIVQTSGIVCNHQTWLDIFIHMYRQPPSHISKISNKKIPFVGYIAT